ncbi:unnamed protein product, partial [marine sediment metagenome]
MGDQNKIGIMEENRYLLTMVVAKRAKQLLAGTKPLVEIESKNLVAIALEEIKRGKVYLDEHKDLKKEDSFKNIFLV